MFLFMNEGYVGFFPGSREISLNQRSMEDWKRTLTSAIINFSTSCARLYKILEPANILTLCLCPPHSK